VELLVPFLIIPGVLITVGYWAHHFREKKQSAWRRVADQFGLRFQPGGWFSKDVLSGEIDGQDVFVDTFTTSSGKSQQTWTRVQSRYSVASGIKIGREGVLSGLGKIFKGDDIQIGDSVFDDAMLLRGPERTLRARLDHRSRATVLELLEDSALAVEDGVVRWQKMKTVVEAHELGAAISQTVKLSLALDCRAMDVEGRFLDILRRDPEPDVRRRCLEQLLEGAGEAIREEALDLARVDDSPRVRLVAVQQGLRHADSVTWDDLKPFARSPETSLRVFAAELVGKHALAGAQSALLAMLDSDDPPIQIAAAGALEVVGGREAVEPLLPLTKGLLTDVDLKTAARAAVESIQARLGAGGQGGLAVVDAAARAGQLSVVAGEGRLSEATEAAPARPPKQKA